MKINLMDLRLIILLLSSFSAIQTAYAADDDLFSTGIVADNVRGLIKPVEKAIISSEIAARISKIPFKSGDSFKKGDLLVDFDCAFYRADMASAEAAFKSKHHVYENNKELLALNAISDIDVSISKSEMEVARAIGLCVLYALANAKSKRPMVVES